MSTDADPGPVLRRRQVGTRLRQLREANGKSLDDVATYLDCSVAKVSRIETGRLPAKIPDVRNMLDLYGVTGADRDAVLEAVRESRQPGWWHTYADVLPEGMDTFLGMLDAAESIEWYEITMIPLLQTRDYITDASSPRTHIPSPRLSRLVDLRMDALARLSRPQPPRQHVILDETALRRGASSPTIMRGQLAHLVDSARQPHVTVQVIPFSAGFTASNVPFAIFGLPDMAQPKIVFIEQLHGGRYESRPEAVSRYTRTFDDLRASALSPDESVALIGEIAAQLR